MIPQAGERLGPYEILGELGGGGMAIVLRAWDGRLHREVAIKLIHDRYAMPGIRDRFLREARAASGLNHPNICTIFDIGEQDGEPYLVMELLEGETLKERIYNSATSEGAMSVDEIVRHTSEIAQALALAHSRGIIHRDIKPANIFLVGGGAGSGGKANPRTAQAKVLDFGLAKVSEYRGKGDSELTTLGAAVGTVSYMSPEQARGEVLDARSDLFSLGVVMYEMASGQLPFQGNTSALVFVQLLAQTPPAPVRNWNVAVPKELEKIVSKLLEKKPQMRYQTAEELVRALAAVNEKKPGWFARLATPKEAAQKGTRGGERNRKDSSSGSAERDERTDAAVKQRGGQKDGGEQVSSGSDPRSGSVAGSDAAAARTVGPVVAKETMLRPKMPGRTLPPAAGSDLLPRPRQVWEQNREQGFGGARGSGGPGSGAPGSGAPGSGTNGGSVPARPGDPRAHRYRPKKDSAGSSPSSGSAGSLDSSGSTGATVAAGGAGRAASGAELQARAAQGARTGAGAGDRRELGAANGHDDRTSAGDGGDRFVGSFVPSDTKTGSGHLEAGSPRPGASGSSAATRKALPRVGSRAAKRRWRRYLAAALAVALGAGVGAYLRTRRAGTPKLNDIVLLTRVNNTTGDGRLGTALLEGLAIDLEESRTLRVRGAAEYDAALELVRPRSAAGPEDAMPDRTRLAAEKLGANEYLVGEIRGAVDAGAAPYAVTVDVMNVATNQRLVRIEDTAESKDRLAGAIDRIAGQIRSEMGESGESISASSVALKKEATSNIDALTAYEQAQEAMLGGQRQSALELYEKAAGFDPQFTQAQLKLATLDRDEFSEQRSAAAARLAVAGSDGASERWKLRAQFRYALDVDGDYDTALKLMQRYTAAYPNDAEGAQALSQVLRLQGRFTEAQKAAEQAYALDPLNVEGYAQAERALLSLDKYDAMDNLQALMGRWDISAGDDALLGEYLAGRQGRLAEEIATVKSRPEDDALALRYAVYLDNTGQLKAGEQEWLRTGVAGGLSATTSADTAAMVSETLAAIGQSGQPSGAPATEASKTAFLAQGALNRALVGDCGDALGLLREAATETHGAGSGGARAEFNLGMTGALCGDLDTANRSVAELTQRLPKNTAAREYYLPDLKAMLALKSGDAAGALTNLQGSRQYDQVSLTPYLRGLAHMAVKQPALAAADFQLVLSHRGASAAEHSTVYPMAEIGLARAMAAVGDASSSSAAYYRFIELWKDADSGEPLVAEARAKTR